MNDGAPLPTPAQGEAQFIVCGIGLSAGGLSALRDFFNHFGRVEGVTFVVVQHQLAADSTYLNVLANFSPFPVLACEEGMRVEAGHLYVAPAQTLVGMEHGLFTVKPVHTKHDHLKTIDYFFRSLGGHYGERSVGVVFSGNSADGTQGLVAIAAAGGFTLAQSLDTAEYNAMPSSAVAIGVVDTIGSPEEIAAAVREHVAKRAQPKISLRSLAKQELHEVCDVVRQATGLDFRHYKESTLFRRIVRRINVLRFTSARDYIDHLEKQPEEARLLTRDLLIGVTSFFRDPDAFVSLEEKVLRRLIAPNRAGSVRIWVAGCGSGQEAYSLAMLAQEIKQATGSRQELQIFATDLDERALTTARRGIYPINVVDEVGAERLERFFERVGRRYRVKKELRQMVVFSPHNLIADPPFSRMDLISCRNLLIYLGAHLQKKLMSVFHYALREGGFLFLGSSEATSGHPDLFRVIDGRSRIAQRKETVVANAVMPRVLGGAQSNWQSIMMEEQADIGRIAQRILLDEFAPAYAIAHEDGQVIYLSGKVDQFMQPPEGRYVNHIMRMARSGLRGGLRGAWTRALKTKRTAHFDGITIEGANDRRRISITVQPMPELGENHGTYMVVFNDHGPAEPREATLTTASADSERMVELLEAELLRTREDLERAVQDLEAANEELKSSNEELLSMNEELQSANEELETSKEEVESAKQALEESNADLLNLLRSTEIATIFLDAEGAVRNFTPAAAKLYNLMQSDIGRPLSHFTHHFVDLPKMPTTGEAVAANAPLEAEARVAGGGTFLRRVTPYRNAEGVPVGTVVTFIDISDRKLIELRLSTKDAVTRALAESASLEAAASRILAAICEHWDWQLGVLWHFDPGEKLLRCSQTHHARGFPAPNTDRLCRTKAFKIGEGVVGHVLEAGKEMWVSDLAQEPRAAFAEMAAEENLRSVFAFPILLGDHKLGVFEFFGDRIRKTEDVLSRMSAIIGSQVGQFIERRNAEQALRRSHDTFLKLIQEAPFGVFLVDVDFKVARVSAGAHKLFGNVPSLIGSDLSEVLHIVWSDSFANEMVQRFRHTLASGERYHAPITIERRADIAASESYDWQIERISMPDGTYGVVCYFYDMTEHRRAEEALRSSEERYRAVVDSQTELVCRFRPEGHILFVNEAYARAQGKTASELVDANLWDFIAPEDQSHVRDRVGRLTPQTPEVRIENRVITKAGVRWMLWTNRALSFDEQGRCVEAQSTGVDITERKEAENHRQLLIDELNHRVKNTLAVIQGIAQQTFNSDSSPLEARTAFYGRLAALGTAHGLLSQQSWERVDLEQLARSAIEASGAPAERVSIRGPSILLEPRRALAIAMALHELCTNAIKYGALSNGSGKLELSWTASNGSTPRLKLVWRESDGPSVTPPSRRGFGSMMIERALAHELGCHAQLLFKPEGVQCTIETPLMQA